MFYKQDNSGFVQALKGVRRKTTVYGEHTLLVEFRLDGGSVVPKHAHPYEQTGYLVSGNILLSIGDDTFDVKPGDCWCVPPNVEHSSKMVVDSVAVEVFSPVREDYLPG